MIPEAKFREIAEGLLAKTRAGKVQWQPAKTLDNAWLLVLPNSVVHLSYQVPTTEPDCVILGFGKKNGDQVGHWKVSDGEENWQLLSDLYREAHRMATGWDKVVEDIEHFLQAK